MPLIQERIIKFSQLNGSAHLKNTPTNSSVVSADDNYFFLMISLVIFLGQPLVRLWCSADSSSFYIYVVYCIYVSFYHNIYLSTTVDCLLKACVFKQFLPESTTCYIIMINLGNGSAIFLHSLNLSFLTNWFFVTFHCIIFPLNVISIVKPHMYIYFS